MDTLRKMEQVETRTEGIFVMPLERISILSSYVKLQDTEGGFKGFPVIPFSVACIEEIVVVDMLIMS